MKYMLEFYESYQVYTNKKVEKVYVFQMIMGDWKEIKPEYYPTMNRVKRKKVDVPMRECPSFGGCVYREIVTI